MPAEAPIRLEVSRRMDFFLPVGALYLLSVGAALAGSRTVLLVVMAVAGSAVAWMIFILNFSKSNNHVKLTSVIFPDGRVQLESGKMPLIAGVLAGRQWCTRRLAVLRVTAGGGKRSLLILSGRQKDAAEFRRLSVWLRQNVSDNADARLR